VRRFTRRSFLGRAGAVAAVAVTAGQEGTKAPASAAVLQSPGSVQAALSVLGKSSLRNPDSLPFPDLPPGTDTMPQIEHIVVLMMENHSYDNFLGTLSPRRRNGRADGFTMRASAVTPPDEWDADGGWNPDGVVASNPNGAGQYQNAFHMSTTCQHSGSPTQEWSASHEQYDNGRLDGFVTGVSYGASGPAGPVSMAYWNAGDLPVLYSLAAAFPIADRWFQSVLGQTDPNRRFLIAGTAAGMTDDIDVSVSPDIRGIIQDTTLPLPANGTIFDRLDAYGISFTNYTASYPTGTTSELYPADDAALTALNEKPLQADGVGDFFADCETGSLPAFSFLDENYSTQSQENPQDIVIGEQLIYDVVNALAGSPNWSSTLLVINYDEHGGYFDHVAPPVALVPDAIPPIIEPGQSIYDGFGRYGFRVPALVISPYSQQDWVTHTVYDHTSILAMIERKWNLPAMTLRDANANDLTGFLDMSALQAGKPKAFEEICPSLQKPATSNCPAVAPVLPPPGSVSDLPAS
jgi:phospholipase C